MDRISSFLPNVLRKRGLQKHAEASFIVQQAQRWLSEKLPKLIQDIHVASFKDATLTVSCAHSIAAQECHQVAQELAAYLCSECGVKELTEVRCVRA